MLKKTARCQFVVRNRRRSAATDMIEVAPILIAEQHRWRNGSSLLDGPGFDDASGIQVSGERSNRAGMIGEYLDQVAPGLIKNRPGECGQIANSALSQILVCVSQKADRKFSRLRCISIFRKPILKALGGRAQEWQCAKLFVCPWKKGL